MYGTITFISVVLHVCLGSDTKFKENISKPVRLITEEELKTYDGSRVCLQILSTERLGYNAMILVVINHSLSLHLPLRMDCLSIWR